MKGWIIWWRKEELEDVNVAQSISKTIDTIQNNFKDVTFVKNIEDNIVIKSDETLLHSLVINILKNAIVACENKDIKVIEISLKIETDNKVVLKIKDNGKGMSEEQLKKVIEPFYTLNKDRNRKISGMGLGLSLCMKICEVLNAELKLESQIEEGTIAIIKFKS